ncbi:hypothetical protein HOS22_gp30 [Rhizobium phage RHEph08]|uniref:Uncharacterized protein n=1 Tax=Rhizobium phage RHEph08 TaxID=1220715 RepID=L7TNR3_9CAUD|nr:hypothetical protein HOS22_gp30 [Rhizobium phage RHEph08]AGC35954.1 hypothetical protein RHEph08_gp030 [Rhizobium phage RHEph08]
MSLTINLTTHWHGFKYRGWQKIKDHPYRWWTLHLGYINIVYSRW